MSKSQVNMSSGDISSKWNKNMKQAVPDIQKGIQALQENPLAKAAAQADKMLTNITASVQSGKWANSLLAVDFNKWKQNTSEKVAQRLSGGVDAAMDKRRKFDAYLVTTLNGVLPTINSMPSNTIEDSVNRVRALMTHMHDNPYKK